MLTLQSMNDKLDHTSGNGCAERSCMYAWDTLAGNLHSNRSAFPNYFVELKGRTTAAPRLSLYVCLFVWTFPSTVTIESRKLLSNNTCPSSTTPHSCTKQMAADNVAGLIEFQVYAIPPSFVSFAQLHAQTQKKIQTKCPHTFIAQWSLFKRWRKTWERRAK